MIWLFLSKNNHDHTRDRLTVVMALQMPPPTTRNLFRHQHQHNNNNNIWNWNRIPLSVNRRRRSLLSRGHLVQLTSTDLPSSEGSIQGQNMTSPQSIKTSGHRSLQSIRRRLILPLSVQSLWVRIVTGKTISELDNGRLPDCIRPTWVAAQQDCCWWIPTWVTCLRPSVQLVAAILLYLFHTLVLTQISIPLPFQLIPNERGNFQSINLDS
jgi:hypothetical protein